MDLQALFTHQQKLDSYIEEKRQVKAEDVFEEKLLAFSVEAGELANEVRSFKFWSSRGPSEDSVILEEYVDGLHFLLSIGNTLALSPEADAVDLEQDKADEKEQTAAFLELFAAVSLLRIEPSAETYGALFSAYLSLAGLLGYTWEDVTHAYAQKNEENYNRQQNGY
ncbi:dUTP diphosphatase [Alkalicoccus luteus]|uniref:dUTPase n=1 Tax=Alkalicoccus luteus TaxID=1237094 RepID=A0A969PMP9_9BACI|nr:dUTP diphosphatase [Alkalicoccus luteus]NJP37040.1 dUTPase [Alkalicoccus luteus]